MAAKKKAPRPPAPKKARAAARPSQDLAPGALLDRATPETASGSAHVRNGEAGSTTAKTGTLELAPPDPATPDPASSADERLSELYTRVSPYNELDKDLAKCEVHIGRPPAPIDPDLAERLAAMFCTDEEIADFFGVGIRTLQRRKKKAEFRERLSQGRNRGKISLRRLQWMTANSGDRSGVVMQIWLGKQILNQKDRVSNEHSGPDGAPIEVSHVRSRLAELLRKRRAALKLTADPLPE
jgi:hypothetical protein